MATTIFSKKLSQIKIIGDEISITKDAVIFKNGNKILYIHYITPEEKIDIERDMPIKIKLDKFVLKLELKSAAEGRFIKFLDI